MTDETMRAVQLAEFGPPSVLHAVDVPVPVPGAGEVLVEVAFANITFVETQFRARGFGPPVELPAIPGNGVGGTVRAVGSGVDEGLVGRRVVTTTGGSGGYAQLVAVPAAGLIDVPTEVDLDAAVALLADGRTALLLADAVALVAGDRALVEAAAGGVGSLLTQLVHTAGGEVVAAAGGPRKVEVARELAAELAVDYLDPAWVDQVRDAVGSISVVFDGVGGDIATAAFGLVERGGRMISYGAASGSFAGVPTEAAEANGVQLLSLPRPTADEMKAASERALAEAAAGRLRPLIGQRFPLERAADAHAAMEGRAAIGKTLLEVPAWSA
jgi:NADPH2:quinone reductase